MSSRSCVNCGREYQHGSSGIKQFLKSKYCSRSCQHNHQRGENHPQWKTRPQSRCVICGTILIPKSRAFVPKTCGDVCAGKYKSLISQGSDNPSWKGGYITTANGYMVRAGDKYKYLHRDIAEKALGRPLKTHEVVHHIDCDSTNNRNNNLLICTAAYHRWLHNEMSRRYAQDHFGRR